VCIAPGYVVPGIYSYPPVQFWVKKVLLAGRIVQNATGRFIYKDAHVCQDNFAQYFAGVRFCIVANTGKDATEGREARLAGFRLPIRQRHFY